MPLQPSKLVWWKIILGLFLVYVQINNLLTMSNLFKANSVATRLGEVVAWVAILMLGCWLVYAGIEPMRRKTPDL
jgi:hypothetical protein